MPIVSSQIFSEIPLVGGKRRINASATDANGKVWDCRLNALPSEVSTDLLAAWEAGFDAYAEEAEESALTDFIQRGGDPAEWTRVYLTGEQTARTAVKAMMTADDPLTVMPTAEHIQANISNAQLQNWFGTEKGTRVRRRTDAMVTNKAFLEADRADTGEV